MATEIRQQYLDVWERLLLPITTEAPMLVLRDYHVDNLMKLPDRTGVNACGLLDFQDAVIGSPAYDLVSLLEDARRDVDAQLQEVMLARYLHLRPDRADALLRDYKILGVQRHCKVAGIFVRLFVRDGKASYLQHLARVVRLLESGLQTERLAPLRAWFDRHFPTRLQPLPQLDREQVLPISGAPNANGMTIES